jgi:DNA polymerase I-like protein with 3'-5' exonuclease and polymerase domains
VETIAGRRVWVGHESQWQRMAVTQKGDVVSEAYVDNKWQAESTSINFPIQGSGADQKYLALKVLKDYLPGVAGKFYFELHDGIFIVVPDHRAETVAHEVKALLSNLPYNEAWGVNLPIAFPVDAKLGKTWGTLKEIA